MKEGPRAENKFLALVIKSLFTISIPTSFRRVFRHSSSRRLDIISYYACLVAACGDWAAPRLAKNSLGNPPKAR
ncbi:MAG: hypothetical protein LBS19_08630 [Clostridiales bacterium]|nr:hypothetical protein [Clostridiales bacterium]